MSQRCISNKIEKTCEGCGLVEVVEMVEQKTPEQIEHLTRWLTIIREYYDLANDRWHKGLVQACSLTCAVTAGAKLYEIKQDPEQELDLEALRNMQPPPEQVN
jgi:hypothetical protein